MRNIGEGHFTCDGQRDPRRIYRLSPARFASSTQRVCHTFPRVPSASAGLIFGRLHWRPGRPARLFPLFGFLTVTIGNQIRFSEFESPFWGGGFWTSRTSTERAPLTVCGSRKSSGKPTTRPSCAKWRGLGSSLQSTRGSESAKRWMHNGRRICRAWSCRGYRPPDRPCGFDRLSLEPTPRRRSGP